MTFRLHLFSGVAQGYGDYGRWPIMGDGRTGPTVASYATGNRPFRPESQPQTRHTPNTPKPAGPISAEPGALAPGHDNAATTPERRSASQATEFKTHPTEEPRKSQRMGSRAGPSWLDNTPSNMVSATSPGWCLVFPKPDHREAIELLNLLTIARSAAMWIATEIAADLPQTW